MIKTIKLTEKDYSKFCKVAAKRVLKEPNIKKKKSYFFASIIIILILSSFITWVLPSFHLPTALVVSILDLLFSFSFVYYCNKYENIKCRVYLPTFSNQQVLSVACVGYIISGA